MLGGARDEVVPRSQMQELWAIMRNRGRDAANKKKPPAAEDDEDDDDEDEKKEKDGSSSSKSRPAKPAARSGSDDRKLPPKTVNDGGNVYVEFPDGMHSEFFFSFLCSLLKGIACFLLLIATCVDDTCVQHGYWSAVGEFVAGLCPKVVPSSSPSS